MGKDFETRQLRRQAGLDMLSRLSTVLMKGKKWRMACRYRLVMKNYAIQLCIKSLQSI